MHSRIVANACAVHGRDRALVFENEFKGTIDYFEVKHDEKHCDRKLLAAKVEAFFCKNPEKRNLNMTLGALSLADM